MFVGETKINILKRLLTKTKDIVTGAWLLANDSKQISDCTGGRNSDAVRYCQSEQNNKINLY